MHEIDVSVVNPMEAMYGVAEFWAGHSGRALRVCG